MMLLRPPLRSVLDSMEAENLLSEPDREALRDAAPAFAGGQSIPWYLHAVMVGAAWVAAPCIAAAPLTMIDSDAANLTVGLLGCAGLCFLRRQVQHPLAAHFMLAFSIVFQVVAIVGLVEVFNESEVAGALSAVLFAALFFAYGDPVHRVVMVLGTFTATALTAIEADLPYVLEVHAVGALIGAALLWGPSTPPTLGRLGAMVRPAALGLLVVGLVCASYCGTLLLREEIDRELEQPLQPILATVPLWGVVLATTAARLRQHGVRLFAPPVLAGVVGIVIVAVAAGERSLLPAALLAILLAFHARDVVGIALALLALVWEVVFLWVAVDVDVLLRAASVLTTGAVLLGAWWALQRSAAARAGRQR